MGQSVSARGSGRMFRMLLVLTTPCILILSNFLNSAQAENVVGTVVEQQTQLVRNPRIFFPLTTSTAKATTTHSSYTNCFYTTATLVACKKRKRRLVLEDMIDGYSKDSDITPSSSEAESSLDIDDLEEEDTNKESPEIESILRDDVVDDPTTRVGKFMLYWTTVVKTSWATKYTSTSATVMCTPSGFSLYSVCGKKKK